MTSEIERFHLKENNEFEQKLEKLQCPFNWNMDDIDSNVSTDYKPHDEEDSILILKFMRTITDVYVQTKEDTDEENIFSGIEKCEEILRNMKLSASPHISIEIVNHILQATSCHVFWHFDRHDRAKMIYKTLNQLNSMTKIERSTLNACISIGWSKYHKLGSDEALKFIRKALVDNSSCDIWHFILGKNLRRLRRDASVGSIPSEEEQKAFLQAYQVGRNPTYGVFLAQMYREQRLEKKALKLYMEIFNSNIASYTIYLRLALGFLQLRSYNLSKICLDKVALKMPEDCVYLHYRGKYYMKIKQFEKAAYYLKKSSDLNNDLADNDYVRCAMIINKKFDPTSYLLEKLQKRKSDPEKNIQVLLLNIAFSYIKKEDYISSLKYFLHAIEIDPNAISLTEHFSIFLPGRSQNVYNVLSLRIFPVIKKSASSLDENTLEQYEELKSYCEEYNKN